MDQIIETVAAQDVENVVQNDVVSSNKQVHITSAMLLVEIEGKRIAWEEGAYRTSNQALYAVLADCLMYAGRLDSEEAHKARNKALDDFYKERGYQVRENTPLITRVVRAVFGGIDRRRTSTYSLVLRRAKAECVQPSQLADWIERNNGVQEIKLGHSKSYVPPKKKVESTKEKIETLPTLAVIRSEALSVLADPDFIHDQCVLLAKQQPDGSFAVKALLRGGAVTAAYNGLYSQLNPKIKPEKAEVVAANDAETLLGQVA